MCDHCHALNPRIVPSETKASCPFTVFDLPIQFSINDQYLTWCHKELQRLLHPDRYALAGDRQIELATDHSAVVNEAYQIISSPTDRAHHVMMDKFGLNVLGENAGTSADVELLGDILLLLSYE